MFLISLVIFLTNIYVGVCRELFAEEIGNVVVMRNACSDMSNGLYQSFDNGEQHHNKKRVVELSSEISSEIKKLLEIDDVEEIFVNMKDRTVCTSSPILYQLHRLLDSGKFSSDLNKFEYLVFPEYWISTPGQNVSTWQNINIENCFKNSQGIFECSWMGQCEIGNLMRCGKMMEIDSSNIEFAFSRQLSATTHIIATRAQKLSIIQNGNIFDIQTYPVLKNIFKACLRDDQKMSIGDIIVQN